MSQQPIVETAGVLPASSTSLQPGAMPPDAAMPMPSVMPAAPAPSLVEPAMSPTPLPASPPPDHPTDPLVGGAFEDPPQEQPSLPINPRPFGATPLRGAGRGPRPGKRLISAQEAAAANRKITPEQKLLILDTWQRSGLSANDFADLVGVNRITLYAWKKKFDEQGPGGLVEQPRKAAGRLPDLTKRTILMLKQANPEWGCQRISDMLYRGPGLPASANTVAKVLREAGYVLEDQTTSPHPDKVRSFERAKPNQLWQTDLFTFILKRQNRRVYLVVFMDDHSRYITGYALHASCTAPLVIEAFKAAVLAAGSPQEVLTDNGPQYVTWRGTSRFAAELQRRGIQHIIATPRRPQTLGKVERFWGTLWRECLEAAVFLDMADSQKRIGHFIDYYNFQRPHQGLEGLTPADRFFGAAPQMLSTQKARVSANALQLARNGSPRAPFYITGQVNGKPFSVHAEGDRVFMITDTGQRQEIDLSSPANAQIASQIPPQPAQEPLPEPIAAHGLVNADLAHEAEPEVGTSPLDEGIEQLQQAFSNPKVSPIPEGGDL